MHAYTLRLPAAHERAAYQLEQAGDDYRVLRRLPKHSEMWCRSMPFPKRASTTRLAIVDTETTGLDAELHTMIELAIVKMTICDVRGDLLDIEPPVSWLEQPPLPIDPRIEELTGLTDAELAGKRFDDRSVYDAFEDIDLIVAHNAKFDLAFMRARFPLLAYPWACSASEIDWSAHAFEGRSMATLLTSAGHFPDRAHRAGPDAWATSVLLSRNARDGRCLAAHLVERARKPTHRVIALRAPFAQKDALKAAGYRWSPRWRAWQLDGDPERLGNESAWLKSLSRHAQPRIEEIDWYNRHAG